MKSEVLLLFLFLFLFYVGSALLTRNMRMCDDSIMKLDQKSKVKVKLVKVKEVEKQGEQLLRGNHSGYFHHSQFFKKMLPQTWIDHVTFRSSV